MVALATAREVLLVAAPPVRTAPPVYGQIDAARALGVSVSYIQKLRAAGVATPSVPIAVRVHTVGVRWEEI